MFHNYQYIVTYTLYGVLFGCCFPILATILELSVQQISVNFQNILQLHQNSALLMIIDTAPIFLGFFAFLIGLKGHQLLQTERQLRDFSVKTAQNQLTVEVEKNKAILESCNDAVLSINELGIVDFFNPAAEKLWGYTETEVIGQHYSKLLSLEHLQVFERSDIPISSEINLNSSSTGRELLINRKNGTAIPVLVTLSRVLFEDKIVVTAFLKNMSQRKKLEEEQKQFLNKIQQKNKELDRFASVVSHDLKTPLRGISSLTHWIERDLNGSAPKNVKENIQLLKGQVSRMDQLIQSILEYSRIGKAKVRPELVDVEEMVQEIVQAVNAPELFTFDISTNLPAFVTERVLLYQIFSNLISNAVKHHDREIGHITVDCNFLAAEHLYQFWVKDDGPGIDPKYQEQIFEIFQTLESKYQTNNTGVGLAIIKKIVTEKGGTIRLISALGTGATFIFTWPS